MKPPTHAEIAAAIEALQTDLEHIRQMVDALVPPKEWYTTQEYAALAGIKPKTVSNYCGKGRIKRIKKLPDGRYLIHRSELPAQ